MEIHTAIATGSAIAICPDPSKITEYMVEVQPTILFAVPRIWNRVHDGVLKGLESQPPFVRSLFRTAMAARSKQKRHERLALRERAALAAAQRVLFSKIVKSLGGKLRIAFSGAAALSPDVADFIDNLGVEVYEAYGMTESGGVITSNRPGERRIGSVGKPVPGVRVCLDSNAPGCAPGEGEVVVYGSGIMAGYHGLDSLTREVMTPDRGLRTGDLGRFDEDGYLYITGRAKELFKLSNGKYVAPAAIEEALQLSRYVSQCVVYGENQPHVVALIVVDTEALSSWARANSIDPAEMLVHAKTRELYAAEIETHTGVFKRYERVRAFLLESEPLTTENGMLTPTLKIRRRKIVERYAADLDSLYTEAAA